MGEHSLRWRDSSADDKRGCALGFAREGLHPTALCSGRRRATLLFPVPSAPRAAAPAFWSGSPLPFFFLPLTVQCVGEHAACPSWKLSKGLEFSLSGSHLQLSLELFRLLGFTPCPNLHPQSAFTCFGQCPHMVPSSETSSVLDSSSRKGMKPDSDKLQ